MTHGDDYVSPKILEAPYQEKPFPFRRVEREGFVRRNYLYLKRKPSAGPVTSEKLRKAQRDFRLE